MGSPKPTPVRFPETLLVEIDNVCSLDNVDRSTLIRQSVIQYLEGKNERLPLPQDFINQCEYLRQIIMNVSDNELIRQEVERLWAIVQHLNGGQS